MIQFIERRPMQRRPRKSDKDHLAFVAARPCLICGTNFVDAHHIKMADARICKPQSSNIGMKADDRYTLPLCRTHHEQLHRMANASSGAATIRCLPARACLYSCSVQMARKPTG